MLAVKTLSDAKSRLAVDLGSPPADLVVAMLSDTIAAIGESVYHPRIFIVSPDPVIHSLRVPGAPFTVIDEVPASALGSREFDIGHNDVGLNTAFNAGIEAAQRHTPEAALVACIQADLPALTTYDFDDVLERALKHHSGLTVFVTDAQGTGTAALITPLRSSFPLRFGPNSARLHAHLGAIELMGHWPGLRQDVDTLADLRSAIDIGVGRHTGCIYPALLPALGNR